VEESGANRLNTFKYVDLFAGIGGFHIALDNLGGSCVFASEIDPACQRMYQGNFGILPHGDIKQISACSIPDHDILAAGFPCQAFSIIGDRQGFSDTRGTLFFEIERIIQEKKPRAIFLENVKQLLTHDHGRTFETILHSLEKLGYVIHFRVLNGLDFGVPQKRERIIIVGFKEDHPFEWPRGTEVRLSLEDVLIPDSEVEKKFYISEHIENKLKAKVTNKPCEQRTIWHENKSGHIGIHPYSCALRANASYNYLLVDGKRRLTPREMLRLQGFPNDYTILVSDSELRKQAGNSVVVPMIQEVGKSMLKAMTKQPIPEIFKFDLFERQRYYAKP